MAKLVEWNTVALEGYESRLILLERNFYPGLADKTHQIVSDMLDDLETSYGQWVFFDKEKGVQKYGKNGEIVLYRVHSDYVEVLGVFSATSDWTNTFKS